MLSSRFVFLDDRTKVALEGELAGPWAQSLVPTLSHVCPPGIPIEIDLDRLTAADQKGEEVLALLHTKKCKFRSSSPFGRALCRYLGIPCEGER